MIDYYGNAVHTHTAAVPLRPYEQGRPAMLLRQVEDDRDRLRENEVAIDEDRQLSGRVHGEKLGPNHRACPRGHGRN